MTGVASLLRLMPEGYEEACFQTGAIVRKRGIKDPNDLMMLVLFHLLTGCSLVEISEISRIAKLGDISDVAFMKRFKGCNGWFKWMLGAIRQSLGGAIEYDLPECLEKYRIIATDASDVAEKGRSGRVFRLHFGLDIVHMNAALFKITDHSVGEHLRNFDLEKNDLVLADRAYSSVAGIEHCVSRDAQYVARMRINSFKPCDADGRPMDLMARMEGTERGDLRAYARKGRGKNAGPLIPVRICYSRKPEEAIAATRKRLKRQESKRQMKISDEAFRFNEYVVVATSLDDSISAADIMELYRYRWQVELYFKRLKSILGFGELPKKCEESIFSWLNGKLMIALLIEKMIGQTDFSPCPEKFQKHLEGGEDGQAAVSCQFS